MTSRPSTRAWLFVGLFLVGWLAQPTAAQSGAAQSNADQLQEKATPEPEVTDVRDLGDLNEEESGILADALERIQLLRQRDPAARTSRPTAAAEASPPPHGHDAGESDADRAAEEIADSVEQAVEEHAEELAAAVESWAESFGAEAENWADSFAAEMEAWAEDYSQNWEQWADEHGEKWEQWAEEFAGKWEGWGEQLEHNQVSQEQIREIVRENLKMIQHMPLSELYSQLSQSSEKFEDLPWDRLHEIEKIVQESLRHSLESVERMGAESGHSLEQQERIRLLQESLKQLSEGLNAKGAELNAAADVTLKQLNQEEVEQAKSRALEAQQHLSELYDRMKAQQAQARIDRGGLERANEADEARAAELNRLAALLDRERRMAREAVQQERSQVAKLRKEIAERVAIDHHERELALMRAQISALRAEIEALRAKQKAQQGQQAAPQ